DGIRDRNVTGVQTCALPISGEERGDAARGTEHERDSEQPTDREQDDVGELIAHRLAGATLRAGHDRPRTAIVPETRPTSTTSSEIGRASCRERAATAAGARH